MTKLREVPKDDKINILCKNNKYNLTIDLTKNTLNI
jgi:hypothetical protein